MKLIKQWKSFTRDQKAAWNKWAKVNRVVLPNWNVDYVTGHKACTLIAANRALFGWTYPITQTPDGYTPLLPTPFLNNVDCGAYTSGAGTLVLRTAVMLNAEESNFLVWATPPVTADVVNPAPLFRFCKAFAPVDDVRRSLTPQLRTDCGNTALLLLDLGAGRQRLGFSALAQAYNRFGNAVPDVDDPALLK